MEQLFFLFTILLLGSAIMTITSSNPIHSIFWLVLVFIYSSGFLISLSFEFLALMIIIIYVGAIAILFLFVIMMLDVTQLKKTMTINNIIPIIFLIFVNILLEIWWIFKDSSEIFFNNQLNEWNLNLPHIFNLGLILYTEYFYSLLIISLLLLVAMVVAILLTLEVGKITRKQYLTEQQHRNNSWI